MKNATCNKLKYMNDLKSIFTYLIIIQVFLFGIALGTVLAYDDATSSPDVTEEVNLDQDIQAADLGTDEPRILPDSPFYFLKDWGRKIQFLVTFNPVDKIKLKQKFADQKLIELKKLVEQKKSREIIKKSIESYQNEVESIRVTSEKIKDKAKDNKELENFLDKFTRQQILHQKLLKKLENQVPPEALEKIRTTRERHLETFGQVMTKLEDRKEKQIEILENLRSRLREKEFDLGEKIIEISDKPISCITLWNPVCGDDGKTYSNQCFAKIALVEISYEGECK